MADRVTNSKLLTYCIYNGPRPKLSVGPAAGFPGRRQSLAYVEAIKKYGHLLEDKYLDKAYNRAQMFFTGGCLSEVNILVISSHAYLYGFFVGDLERLFLVLRETVAVERMQAKDAAQEDNQPIPAAAPAPPPPPKPEASSSSSFQRGIKRESSAEHGTPSKKR